METKPISKLREARERRGWTQASLAQVLGVSRPAVYAWESGIARPRGSVMRLLSMALVIPVEEIQSWFPKQEKAA
ncbi:MAG: hypothetical protein A2Y38_13325 [Spirochaetes bacterium GWB1_59_5]|nr:MAG: hypothetical protein A2Y38_13325 [Spirochaetes bacterium GWB1_59_5]